jgi:glycosyltransferase involved in cell wall biosynthesis
VTGQGPRVLHLLDNLGLGGAEVWLMELLRHWRQQGPGAPRCDFLATGGKPGAFDQEAQDLGSKVFYLRYGVRELPAFALGFRRILKSGGYDALHDHADYASGWHYQLGEGRLPPVRLTHIHNSLAMHRSNYGVTARRRTAALLGKALVGRHATLIGGTSRQVVTEYGFDAPGFARIPKAAVYCGFDPSRFAGDDRAARIALCEEFGWSAEAKLVLIVGRIDPSINAGDPMNHKNSSFAVQVAIQCVRRDPAVRVLFAGSTSAASPLLEARISAVGATGKIILAGARRDIERLMLASDVLLFPSKGEGLGMVAVEAQAAGLPVLASTAVPQECAVTSLVRFKPLDDGEEDWAEELLELAALGRDRAAANRMIAGSPFAIANSAAALESIYSGRIPA